MSLPPPELVISIIEEEENDIVFITWQPIEWANSYKVFATNNIADEEWEQIAVVTDSRFSEQISERGLKFYYVVASTEVDE